jgi:SAM-dependent methyltransferase
MGPTRRAGWAPLSRFHAERLRTPFGCLLVLLLTVNCERAGRTAAQTPAPAPPPGFAGLAPSPLPDVRIDTGSPQAPSAAPYRGRYGFSEDWFSHDIPVWEKALAAYKGKPDLRYLEVGAFEGRSVLWALENILTAPGARATVIDPFEGDLKSRFLANLKSSGEGHKVTVIVGYSQIELRKLPLESYDIAYIDGSHAAADVLEDAVLTWRLLKPGGLLIFDDYPLQGWKKVEPIEERPGPGMLAFYTFYGRHFEVVHVGWQLILRKKSEGATGS